MAYPEHLRSPTEPAWPSDQLILAALARAMRHDPRDRSGAPLAAVLGHLAIPRRSARARAVRARLEELERSGELTRTKVYGVARWALSTAAARRLEAAAAGGPPPLPESPQHASWRRAHTAAGEELEGFALRLSGDLAEAQAMLAALAAGQRPPHSDCWLLMGRRLLEDCRRLGSAWHCLREWPEPHDARPDRDEEAGAEGAPPSARVRALRAGRRNITLWADADADGDQPAG